MYEPNVMGDWQEYDEELAGLRVRVHGLKKGDVPLAGRNDKAKGLTYASFRVTVENRAAELFSIDLRARHCDVRLGRDGEAAFIDPDSKWIDGFDVYPMRRATAVVYAAGPVARLGVLAAQVQMKVDDEWTHRYVWVGGVGMDQASTRAGKRASNASNSIASEVSRFLEEETGPR